jgi:SAM-dependent methyltransferase
MFFWHSFLVKRYRRNLLFFGKDINLVLSHRIWDFISPFVKHAGGILDVGCGTGTLIFNVSNKIKPNAVVVGIDVDKRRCEMTLLKTQREIVCAEALHLPFANKTFNLVFSTMVIEHVDDKALMREVTRVLKDGGFLVLTTVVREEDANYFYKDEEGRSLLAPDHIREYSSGQEVLQLIKSYGFVTKAFVIYPFRLSLPTAFLSTLYRLFPNMILERLATTDFVSTVRTKLIISVPKYSIIEVVMQNARSRLA